MVNEVSGSQSVELQIQLLGGDHVDPDDVDHLARMLRTDLEEIPGIDEVSLASSEDTVPHGSKAGAEVLTLGALLLAVLPDAVPALIDFLKDWTLRPGSQPIKIKAQAGEHSVEVEYDPDTMTAEEIKKLVVDLQMIVKQSSAD